MNKGLLIVLGIVVVGGGAVLYSQHTSSTDPLPTPPPTGSTQTSVVKPSPKAEVPPSPTATDLIPKEIRGDWLRPSNDDFRVSRITLVDSKLQIYRNRRPTTGSKVVQSPLGLLTVVFVKQDTANTWIVDTTGKNQFGVTDKWRHRVRLTDPENIGSITGDKSSMTKPYLIVEECKGWPESDGRWESVVIDAPADRNVIPFFMPKDDYDKWGDLFLKNVGR